MREKNRKPIANNRKRLPQFTTMNVIDGQAGLVIYSSLIFYSLTIDNILNIIVLLILVGVSIATLTGENGILTRASDADVETRAATVEERKNLWKTEKQTDNYIEENTAQTLEELLDDLEGEDLITAEERIQIEETGHVVIGSKDISFSDGLTEASYTITSSLDEVNFNKIITEGDIAIEKPGFTSYTIEGVSASQDGEYVTSGSVRGKSGNLEIVRDINDATFSYTLTNFMQGDETFYCKINIDGEEYYKEIKVIQGDVVTYEEDFVGIQYTGTWIEIKDENCSGGKARYSEIKNDEISITFLGSGIDYSTVVKADGGSVSHWTYSINEDGLETLTDLGYVDWKNDGTKEEYCKYSDVAEKKLEAPDSSLKTKIRFLNNSESPKKFYLDAIYVYR